MPPCHTQPFVLPGILIAASAEAESPVTSAPAAETETCDCCGSARLEWRKCKLVCANCRQINKSCADL